MRRTAVLRFSDAEERFTVKAHQEIIAIKRAVWWVGGAKKKNRHRSMFYVSFRRRWRPTLRFEWGS